MASSLGYSKSHEFACACGRVDGVGGCCEFIVSMATESDSVSDIEARFTDICKLNLVDFFKEVPQFIVKVGPILCNLYGPNWEKKLEAKELQANFVHMTLLKLFNFEAHTIKAPSELQHRPVTQQKMELVHPEAAAGTVETETRGYGFWKGCCAALCCCVLDACF
ncbi:hypothetical protein POM88_014647 [Heracleum sosnowskyi]|uniref:Uncharacterized protein n=1 Tax=Heracleum sosnowskyi TaxID=360622 RepID=A0AAD8IIB6_9APIA|nr:hypothetical protein POM88_014601 [Heracleum sosnowskyi]KAK1386424.1 hypothetical protein POM88_014602 [Heracleum sosnowskyi]KAK1386469.1 hypothetical protein POM88_014647 [Heracleum sosnowskyi]